MFAFFAEWLFVVAMLPALGMVGGFVVVPFRKTLPFAALGAPFAGLLLLAFGASLAYNTIGLPLVPGFAITIVAGVAATALMLRSSARDDPFRWCWRSLLMPAIVAVVLAGVVTWYTTWATVVLGHPGLAFWFGTDHLGYAHVADWIVEHPPWEQARVDPAFWYESWPALMLVTDPRFGAFSTVALIALVRGLSASFAYDPASAVAHTVTILGVAALFARSRGSLILLVLGLLSSHWFDYSRSGYFGKALGYPAAFFVAGLFMLTPRPLRPTALCSLLVMLCGAAVVYTAEAVGMLIGLLGASFLAARVLLCGSASVVRPIATMRALWPYALVLALMAPLALIVRGYVGQSPSGVSTLAGIISMAVAAVSPEGAGPAMPIPWTHVRLTLADLDHQGFGITELTAETLEIMLAVSLANWGVLGLLAIWRRDPIAMALVWGPMLLAVYGASLTSQGGQWTRYQLPGTFYPLALCAAARILDGGRLNPGFLARLAPFERLLAGPAVAVSVALIMVVSIGLHVPRIRGVIQRYASIEMPAHYLYSRVEIEALAAAIGDRSVRVDIDQPHLSIVPLVELGRRGIDIQWARSSWKYVLGYRGWPRPQPDRPADLTLQVREDPPARGVTTVLETRQYRLTAPAPSRAGR